MQEWEYCELTTSHQVRAIDVFYYTQDKSEHHFNLFEAMKKLGIEGWELVAVKDNGVERQFFFNVHCSQFLRQRTGFRNARTDRPSYSLPLAASLARHARRCQQ